MFNFFKKQKVKKNVPNTKTVAFGMSEVPQVGQWLQQSKYDEVAACYQNLENNDKSLLLEGVTLNATYVDDAIEWQSKEPNNYLANLFSGSALTFKAWEARTGLLAKHVTEEQARGFYYYLEQAYEHLAKATNLNPSEPEAYARLIRVFMGFSEKEKAQESFDTLVSLDKGHLAGHMFMVNLLAPKWLGSYEEMKDFAVKCANQNEHPLLYTAYLMFAVQSFIDLADKDYTVAEQRFKWKYEANIMTVYKKANSSSITSLQRYHLHNYFSYLFYVLSNKKLRDKEIDAVGENISMMPWAYAEVEGLRDLQLMKFS